MHKTGVLSLGQGTILREFYLKDGLIANATSVAHPAVDSGEHVRRILLDTLPWMEGNFEFLETQLSEEVDSVNLRLDPQALILDIYRQLDEEEAPGGPPGGPDEKAPAADEDDQGAATASFAEGLRLAIVDALLKDDLSVPLLPTVVNKVLEVTRRDDYSLQDLSNVIMADQVIAAQVLRQANSALYGSSSEIDSLPMAVSRLGSQIVTNIVLSLSLQSVSAGADRFLERKRELWRHSLSCAILARTMAVSARLDPELAFVCGLMMDFGKIVLLSLIQEVMEKQPQYRAASQETIEEIVEVYHPKVGGVVGKRWNLPAAVREAITCHHILAAAKKHKSYAAISSLSDSVATLFEQTPSLTNEDESEARATCAVELAELPAAVAIGVSSSDLQSVLDSGEDYLKFAQEFLAIQ